ncbi:MAG: amidohydrolase family protein [Propionibacteriaceae bacterium]
MTRRTTQTTTTRRTTSSVFTRAYAQGVTEQLAPDYGPGTRPAFAATAMVDRAAPAEPIALHGAVITPTGALKSGYVVVESGVISEISRTKPSGARVHRTDGVIVPGLIDLHSHPEFNVFAAWEPPHQFPNRYSWRASDVYHQLVRDPQNRLLTELQPQTQLRYAEIRALIGGVTAIQGASGKTSRATSEPLVRNVDLWIFGQHRARAMIDLPSSPHQRDYPRLQKIIGEIAAGEVDAFYLHLAEGARGDRRSLTEFQRFLDFGAATPATVVIHGSALEAPQIHQLADAGCKLVWSPQSNLRLYAQTTLAAEALRAGIPVALGADWLPSGSMSLLAEMKVARAELSRQGHEIAAADLVTMVTSGAAEIAGLGHQLGSLAPGRPADLVVLERHHDDPYENVCLAEPNWVELVMIGGDLAYGRQAWYADLTADSTGPTIENLTAWGKPMTLDTGFDLTSTPQTSAAPSLSELRQQLVQAYPPVGPVFA